MHTELLSDSAVVSIQSCLVTYTERPNNCIALLYAARDGHAAVVFALLSSPISMQDEKAIALKLVSAGGVREPEGSRTQYNAFMARALSMHTLSVCRNTANVLQQGLRVYLCIFTLH